MDNNDMKNMIILKDLPSNLVEQAIVIFKKNKKIKKFELAENKKNKCVNTKNNNKIPENDFFIKEAQNVIADYISRVENQDFKSKDNIRRLEEKNKKLKILSGILICFIAICMAIIIF